MKKILTFLTVIALLICGGYIYHTRKTMSEQTIKNPEFNSIWNNFIENDVKPNGNLDSKSRYLTILAVHIAMQSVNEYKIILAEALENGVTAIEAQETLFQSAPYAGMAKAFDFFNATNEVFASKNISLPLPKQSTTNLENRLEKGIEVQSSIFGAEAIHTMRANAPENLKNIQDFLSANCFGDYYTRNGLDIPTRELITFSILVAMGGADPQVKAHVQANLNVGNSQQKLFDTLAQLLPYIGYPRTLNGIAAINEITTKS